MSDQVKPKRTCVNILAVENGYVVAGSSPFMRDARYAEEDHVFESFDAMVAFLRGQIPVFPLPKEAMPAVPTTKRTYQRNK